MIVPTFSVVKIAERRNQQNKILFTGSKKECLDFFEIEITKNNLNKIFIGQYIDGVLNKIIKTNGQDTKTGEGN